MTWRPIPEEIGKIVAYQYAPCKNAGKDIYCDAALDHLSEVPIQKCTSKKQKEIEEYWIKKWSERDALIMASNAVCLNLEDIYIAGEPSTNSEASLIIAFTKHPDIVTDLNDPSYDWEKDWVFVH